MKTFLLLSLTITVALAVPVPEWVPVNPEEGGAPLARLLPEQGRVIQEDIKPDAALEKVERPPAEVSPKVQEKPAEQETVVRDKPAEQEPFAQDKSLEEAKPAEQEPLSQDKSLEEAKPAEQEPIEENKPAEQESLKEDKLAEQEPLAQDKSLEEAKPAEQEPLKEEKLTEQEPIEKDKPAEQEPLKENKLAEQEPIEEDKPAEQEPLKEDKLAEQELLEKDTLAEQEPSVEQVQEKVGEEDESEGAAEEKDLTENEIIAEQESQVEEDENVFDLKNSLDTNFLPEQGSIIESDYESDDPVEEEPVEQEIHPAPGRPQLVKEEPVVELVPENEEAGMDGRLFEEEAEMAEEPKMVLISEEEEQPVEDDFRTETDWWGPGLRSVEKPRVQLEPLLEDELTSDDEPGTEAQPAEEEDFLGEEGPVMPGETVVEVEESLDQEPGMEMEPEGDPEPRARSGLAKGPLMDGITLKQAMMEEEPDMWVGPNVMQEVPVQEMEEYPYMERGGDESVAMPAGMDTDSKMLVGVRSDIEEPYEEEAGPNEEEFPDTVSTKWSSCSGVVIDGRCYQFFRGPKEAPDAEFFCQNNFPNGHLASVTNYEIHQQMMNLMAQNGGYTRTWVGGLKYLKTGFFIWLDGAHWEYADWLTGEPNDTSGVEDCIELLSNGKFNDMPCWDLRAFICSYPV